ncbi:class I SAM-dependent methyltransferase [Dethiosulfatarculus sandiegensis]|uniref:SAM-dependent methyltransferase n=1 Tax=Dethiosulfatarculus sandiegensis TaxID=1429043 RepID=A0A0D2J6I7_9BACT|nr:class I SAM-dependent methyltransferase [Dethiosulfatarculus sandiegensis]KIX11301.1 SAM-dependent methyltransferase [Dethiosulfatarculus sandiegensis]
MNSQTQAKPWANQKAVRHYDLTPDQVQQLDNDQTWFFMSRLVARHLPPGSSLLDLGCAAGSLHSLLNKRGVKMQYTGVDVTPELIQAAKHRYPEINFQVASALELPFEDASFDVVFSKGTLFVTQDPHEALLQALRVAKRTLIVDLVLNKPGEPDQTVTTEDRGSVHLLGPQGLSELGRALSGCRVVSNLLNVGLTHRDQLHPAYQKMNYLKHLVLCVHKETK